MSESRLGPPPVEPMSDLSWARVERGLWARLDGTSPTAIARKPARRWTWLAAPALVAAAGAALYLGTRDDAPAAVVADAEPTRVTSGAAPSTIAFGDAHVTLDAESAVVLSRASDPGGSTAVLDRGAAWFAIAKRTRPFVVVAGDTVVRVLGTRFRVARFEERATVEVDRGLVDVTFQGITVQVGPGQRWTSARPTTVEPGSPETAGTRADDRATDEATDEATGAAPDATTDETTAAPVAKPHPARKDPTDAKARPTTAPITSNEPLPVKAIDLDRLKFERLTAAEARDPEAALTGYLELSRGRGRWAEVALYAAGRLAADRGDARAPTLLSMYLRRYPRGANADDARKLLDRLKGAP